MRCLSHCRPDDRSSWLTPHWQAVAAAEETGDLSVVLRAAGMLGAPSEALDHAERAGLLLLSGNTVNFRHPLARSAIYQHATFAARRAAHEALARELHREQEVDRRAWHLAAAAVEPDAELAAALAASANTPRDSRSTTSCCHGAPT